MQLSELREALKITLPYSFAQLAKNLDINEATLYRKLNGSNKFKAAELIKLHKILLPSAPLDTFLMAYGFEDGTYEPLAMSLVNYEILKMHYGCYEPAVNTLMERTVRDNGLDEEELAR